MREVVRAALPLGVGVVLDPFMGAGSTIAAAQAVGYESIGLELDPVFFRMAERAIPRLAKLEERSRLGAADIEPRDQDAQQPVCTVTGRS
jgi:site-specific DNA-methyltransferase (adenine-specific)